ncbi:MAG TPA: class I SAM-dependent methyltransferase [Candidatus Methanofastidiosa archaeon]|nr:class I SAM-dependent methyltransferase [Candidatus Methanofastidiosa archaeon]HPR40947.1 class I SAM-dependent methyltransferase [Candidatus Methanofastidiosa archaeon]
MDYIKQNKQAWEEAFDHRRPDWGEENYKRLRNEQLPFFCADMVAELKAIDFEDKTVAQFCCNNGRELLSLMQLGAQRGIGFDIAENILQQARETAIKAGITNYEFVNANILDIDGRYHNSFDFVLFTIGAITWFQDLKPLFKKASDCLKPNGIMLIHDFHPFMNMLPMPGEPDFKSNQLDKITYPYFRNEPWIENKGIGYMSEKYESKTFTSFSHTLSDIINAILFSKMSMMKLNEYDYDVGLTNIYDNKGYPLSFILLAKKS